MAINENDAFQVFNALQAGQVPEPMKPRALSMLSAYRSETVKKMQDVFGNLQTLDVDDGSFITADRFNPGSGDKLRKKEANVLWLANRYNRPTSEIRGKYDFYKADASSIWGDAMLDDEAFFSKASSEVSEQKKKAQLIQSAQEAAFRSAVTMGDDVADFGSWQFSNPDPVAFSDEVQNAWEEEKQRTMDRIGADGLGLADRVVRTLRHEQGVANEPDAWLNQTVEMLTQLKATDPEKYDLVMAVAKAKGEKSAKPEKEVVAGAAEQFLRTSADIISGTPRFLVQAAAEGSAQLAEMGLTTAENPELLAARARGRQAVISDLKDLGEGIIDPIESRRKGWAKHAENAVYFAAGSVPTMVAPLIPGGQGSLVGMFANESYEDFRRAGWTGADALAASVTVGRFQAAVERASEAAAAIPGVAQWMAKYGAKPGMSFVKTWLARSALRAGIETAEEAIQQAAAPAAQELASAVFQSIPDRPEGQKLRDVVTQFVDTDNSIPLILSVLPLGMLGAGISTSNDMRLVATVTRDPRLLRAVMSEADARKIEQEQDATVRAEMIKRAWIATPTDQIVSKIKDIITQDKKTVEESKSVLAEAEKALMIPKIRRDDQGWKVEKNGQMVRVSSREAAVKMAYASLDDYERTMYESMAVIADDMLGKNEALEVSARTQTLEDEVREGRLSPVAAAQRAELSAKMAGMTPEQAQKARWVVLGKNNIEIINNVRTAVSRVFGGGNVITAMHEHAHGRWTMALQDGYVTHDEGLSWVRMAEDATGLQFLPTQDNAAVTPEMLEEAIVEVISADNIGRRKEDTRFTPGAISRGIASALMVRKRRELGTGQKGKMSEERLKDFKAFMASYREFWGVVLRNARALMRSRKEGKLGQDYQDFLDKLMDVDIATQQEVQAAQEAVDLVEGKPAFSLANSRAKPLTDAPVVQMPDGAQLVGPSTFSIQAYHGTPHKVDKFKTAKIGTGEGAQAYGWGLYFAESEKVGAQYRDNLSKWSVPNPQSEAGYRALGLLTEQRKYGRVDQEAKAKAKASIGVEIRDGVIPNDPALVAEIEKQIDGATGGGGNLYTVELLPDEDEFLDWDKPLSEQSEKVKAAIAEYTVNFPESISAGQWYSEMTDLDPERPGTQAKIFSQRLSSLGIPGIKYLDAGSRGAGDGTRNYVIFDENLVRILEENGQKVEGQTFSLAPASAAQDAEYLAAVESGDMEKAQRMVDAAAKQAGYNSPKLYHGTGAEFSIFDKKRGGSRTGAKSAQIAFFFTDDEATAKSYAIYAAEEGPIKDALKKAELAEKRGDWDGYNAAIQEAESLENYEASLKRRESAKVVSAYLRGDFLEFDAKGQTPQELSDGDIDKGITNQLRKAQRNGKTGVLFKNLDDAVNLSNRPSNHYAVFEPSQIKSADPVTYDDAGNVIPLSQRFQPESADIRFSLAPRSLVSVADDIIAAKMAKPEYKERFYSEARARLAKIRAKQGDVIPDDATKRDRQMAALRTLDAILAAFPPEIRGKVGGFVRMADMKTDAARQKELDHRLNILERYVENDAKKYYGQKMDKLLERAKPKKEAGKKPKGKLGSDVHDLFATIETAMDWTAEKAEAHAEALENLIAGGTLTADQEAHDKLEAHAVRLVAAWKEATSAQREAAVKELTAIYETAYLEEKQRVIAKREKRQKERQSLVTATGKEGKATERDDREMKDAGTGFLFKSRSGFLTFKQVMRWAFGDSEIAQSLAERERQASNTMEDSIQDKMDGIDALFKRLAGSSYAGEQLRWQMAQKSIEVQGRKLSELEALAATMMWMQEDGRRHMIGNLDENGKPVSKWHYNQKFVDAIEAKLSPEAKAVRSYLLDQYSQEWESLNAVYSKLNGVNLPNIPLYSPITVTPMQVKGGQMVDPVTGAVMTGSSTTPGTLKTRSGKIAEPNFRDVVKTYIAHTKQIEHWKAYAELIEDARALLGDRDVLNAIEAASGVSGRSVVGGWIDYFAEGGNREAAAFLEFSQGVDRITSRAASMALIGRLGTLFVQATQLAAAAAKMPLSSYTIRLGKLMAGQLDYSAAFESEFIQRRIKQQPPLVQEAMKGLLSKKPTRVKQAQRELGKLISGADGLFTAGTFAIVYDYQMKQAKELGLPKLEAENYAMQTTEQIVDEIAQPTRAGARSLLENRMTGWGARLAWAFASESRKNLGLMLAESQKGMTNKRFARAAFYVVVLNSLSSWIIRAAWNDAKDSEDDEVFDERNWNVKRLAITAATDWTKGVPLFGDMLQAGAFAAAGEYQPEGNLLSGAGHGVQSGIRLADRLNNDGIVDGLLSQESINDADLILSAMGLANDNIAAAASITHLIKDVSKIVKNVTD